MDGSSPAIIDNIMIPNGKEEGTPQDKNLEKVQDNGKTHKTNLGPELPASTYAKEQKKCIYYDLKCNTANIVRNQKAGKFETHQKIFDPFQKQQFKVYGPELAFDKEIVNQTVPPPIPQRTYKNLLKVPAPNDHSSRRPRSSSFGEFGIQYKRSDKREDKPIQANENDKDCTQNTQGVKLSHTDNTISPPVPARTYKNLIQSKEGPLKKQRKRSSSLSDLDDNCGCKKLTETKDIGVQTLFKEVPPIPLPDRTYKDKINLLTTSKGNSSELNHIECITATCTGEGESYCLPPDAQYPAHSCGSSPVKESSAFLDVRDLSDIRGRSSSFGEFGIKTRRHKKKSESTQLKRTNNILSKHSDIPTRSRLRSSSFGEYGTKKPRDKLKQVSTSFQQQNDAPLLHTSTSHLDNKKCDSFGELRTKSHKHRKKSPKQTRNSKFQSTSSLNLKQDDDLKLPETRERTSSFSKFEMHSRKEMSILTQKRGSESRRSHDRIMQENMTMQNTGRQSKQTISRPAILITSPDSDMESRKRARKYKDNISYHHSNSQRMNPRKPANQMTTDYEIQRNHTRTTSDKTSQENLKRRVETEEHFREKQRARSNSFSQLAKPMAKLSLLDRSISETNVDIESEKQKQMNINKAKSNSSRVSDGFKTTASTLDDFNSSKDNAQREDLSPQDRQRSKSFSQVTKRHPETTNRFDPAKDSKPTTGHLLQVPQTDPGTPEIASQDDIDGFEPQFRQRCHSFSGMRLVQRLALTSPPPEGSDRLQARLQATSAGLEELHILREKQRLLVEEAKKSKLGKTEGIRPRSNTFDPSQLQKNKKLQSCTQKADAGENQPSQSKHPQSYSTTSKTSSIDTVSTANGSKIKESNRMHADGTEIKSNNHAPIIKKTTPCNGTESVARKKFIETVKHREKPAAEKTPRPRSENLDDMLRVFPEPFMRPRTLSGSRTRFEFPSPMHAVLLQCDDSDVEHPSPALSSRSLSSPRGSIRTPSPGTDSPTNQNESTVKSSTCQEHSRDASSQSERRTQISSDQMKGIAAVAQSYPMQTTDNKSGGKTSARVFRPIPRAWEHKLRYNNKETWESEEYISKSPESSFRSSLGENSPYRVAASSSPQNIVSSPSPTGLSSSNTGFGRTSRKPRKELSIPTIQIQTEEQLNKKSLDMRSQLKDMNSKHEKFGSNPEEGYFSEPGTPTGKQRMSIVSDSSYCSTGSSVTSDDHDEFSHKENEMSTKADSKAISILEKYQ